MNIGQRNPNQNNAGSTQFLNFSDALHHLRWGDRIARRSWPKGQYLIANYTRATVTTDLMGYPRGVERAIYGIDLMAEDWYVL